MLHSHLIAKTSPVAIPENIVLWKEIRVTVLGEGLFRIEKDTDKKFCDIATQSIWFRNMPAVNFRKNINDDTLIIKTERATLCVTEDVKNSTVTVADKTVRVSDIQNLPGAYRSLDNCNGDFYSSYGTKYAIKLEDGIVSSEGVGMHDDTASLLLNDEGRITQRDDDDLDIYIFAHGSDYRGALRDLFMISGRVPIIPRYAFGNWWSRFYPYSDKEYLHVVDKLAERDVPITVATVDMDWHWYLTVDEEKQISARGKNDEFHGGTNGWTGYSWNTHLFPDYKDFLKKLEKRGLKTTLNLHPASGVRFYEDMYEDMAKAMGIDPKTEQKIPFDFTSDKFINAYFDVLHKPYERDGVEFWWIDWQQGTTTGMPGLDPLWALNHYHTLDNAVDHRPLILSRYNGIGSHRYPLGFSGDTHITWKSLEYIPYFTAMGTNAGYTWWSHDIGGHMDGYKDDQLYARYVQFGAFSPINRLHCANPRIMTKEPMIYMNGAGLVAEEFLKLRHRMIPFLYSSSYDTRESGQALIEPMYYLCPEEKDAYECPGQYLFGDQMIVAPITKPLGESGLATMNVWLPEGRWTDIFTGDEYDGGKWVEMTRWLETIPVLAKEGGFFVLDGRKHTNDYGNPDVMEVMIFSGNGEYVLHEDKDGNDAWMHTKFISRREDGKQVLTMLAEGDLTVMPKRTYKFMFKNIPDGKVSVLANGEPVDFETDAGEYLTVIVENTIAGAEYRVEVEHTRNAFKFRESRLIYNMMRINGNYGLRRCKNREFARGTDEEARAAIFASEEFTLAERKRIAEGW